jgi:hypothetical protein
VSKRTVRKIAGVINAAVDLDYFDEHEETAIFEHSVAKLMTQILQVLPSPFKALIKSGTGTGIDDETAVWLKERLLKYVRKEVSLPYLEEVNEYRVCRCVVELLVESMKQNQSFERVCHISISGPLFVNVFVKGSVDLLSDEGRDKTVEMMVENFQVPTHPSLFLSVSLSLLFALN